MSLAYRVPVLLAGAAMALAAPAAAQVSNEIVLNIMRECAKIGDPTARLACYDNNIRAAGGNPASVPGQMAAPSGGGAAVQQRVPGGFGADDLAARSPERFEANRPARGPNEVTARVSQIAQREPGMYLVTLEDGAQWRFTEGAGAGYRAPRRGDQVEIRRGALGSYLMAFDNQQAVRVERVR